MPDTTAEPITLQAFIPAELRIASNARTDAEADLKQKHCIISFRFFSYHCIK